MAAPLAAAPLLALAVLARALLAALLQGAEMETLPTPGLQQVPSAATVAT